MTYYEGMEIDQPTLEAIKGHLELINITKLSKIIGVSRPTLIALKKGERTRYAESTIQKLCDFLNIEDYYAF